MEARVGLWRTRWQLTKIELFFFFSFFGFVSLLLHITNNWGVMHERNRDT